VEEEASLLRCNKARVVSEQFLPSSNISMSISDVLKRVRGDRDTMNVLRHSLESRDTVSNIQRQAHNFYIWVKLFAGCHCGRLIFNDQTSCWRILSVGSRVRYAADSRRTCVRLR
jgi:hypothetical protein